MPLWKLYDYLRYDEVNDFERWCRGLQKSDLARLNRKLKMLEDTGPDLGPKLLAGPIRGYAHIYKLRIRGSVEIRPLLCRGPINNHSEFTLLKGAFEVGDKWAPASAPAEAKTRRQEVINAPNNRRCLHFVVT
jgi:hypothetical protein